MEEEEEEEEEEKEEEEEEEEEESHGRLERGAAGAALAFPERTRMQKMFSILGLELMPDHLGSLCYSHSASSQ